MADSAENDACSATTESGTPCQKRGPHAGHWFMSDDQWACLMADHFDPANVLSMTPLVHLDVPCPRRPIPPAGCDGSFACEAETHAEDCYAPHVIPPAEPCPTCGSRVRDLRNEVLGPCRNPWHARVIPPGQETADA